MANHWFKFYGGEYISDPKMLALSACERSCWITLLSYASMDDFDGVVRYLSEDQLMAQAGVRFDEDEWNRTKGVLDHLQQLGMIIQNNGEIQLLNWRKRQEMFLSGAERTHRYRQRKENAEKIEARQAVIAAIKDGKLKRGVCEVCESEKVEAYHDSYAPENWLKIRWLCKKHHERSHSSDANVTRVSRNSDARLDKTRLDKTRNTTAQFEEFWKLYPRKEGKKKAQQAFEKINPSEELFQEIKSGLNRNISSDQWSKENGKFIPHATTWLNGERWTDEVQAGKKKSTKYDKIRTTQVR